MHTAIMYVPYNIYIDTLSMLLTVSELDIFVLYERFQQLNPDSNGFISKNMFDTEEYSDPFCRQVSHHSIAIIMATHLH